MGSCLVIVKATGAHHNGAEYDIDQITTRYVEELKAKGHTVEGARLTSGAEWDLLDANARQPLKNVAAPMDPITEEIVVTGPAVIKVVT